MQANTASTNKVGKRTLLFVYGTLRSGKPLHSVIADSSWALGEVYALGFALWTNNGFYPFIAPHVGGRVRGELYALDALTLESCDQIELGAGYTRITLDVALPDGTRTPALAYLGNATWRATASYVGEEWEGW